MSRFAQAAQSAGHLSVDWCGEVAAPPQLIEHLEKNHISVRIGGSGRSPSPSRISAVSTTALRVVGKRARALNGRRIAVLHPDASVADTIAQALRARGAEVALMSLDPATLVRIESLDPEVIVVEPHHYVRECWRTIAALLRHPLLRWSCALLSPSAPLAMEGGEMQDIPALCADIQLLCADYDAATVRAQAATEFTLALESLGPGRVLRLLVDSKRALRARFTTSTVTVEIDVAEGLIVGARGGSGGSGEQALLGTACISALLNETTGTVQVRPVAHPAATNIMAPLDAVLASALRACVQSPELVPGESAVVHHAVTASVAPVRTRTLIGMFAAKLPATSSIAPPQIQHPSSARPMSVRPLVAASARAAEHPPASEPISVDLAVTGPLERVSRQSRIVLRKPSAKLFGGGIIAALVASTLLALDAPPAGRSPFAWEARIDAAPFARVSLGRMVAAGVLPAASASASRAGSPTLLASDLPSGATPSAAEGDPRRAVERSSSPVLRTRPSRAQVQRANALTRQGTALLRRKRTLLAKRRFEAALQEQPGHARALAGLIAIACEQHDRPAALLHAQTLAKAHPSWPTSHLLLGDARALAGDRTAAVLAWRTAARLGSRPARDRLKSLR